MKNVASFLKKHSFALFKRHLHFSPPNVNFIIPFLEGTYCKCGCPAVMRQTSAHAPVIYNPYQRQQINSTVNYSSSLSLSKQPVIPALQRPPVKA